MNRRHATATALLAACAMVPGVLVGTGVIHAGEADADAPPPSADYRPIGSSTNTDLSAGAAARAEDQANALARLVDVPGVVAADSTSPPPQLAAPARARFVASRSASIPVPPTGTLTDIDWAGLGAVTAGEAEGYLEYNALCDWMWMDDAATAAQDTTAAAAAERVLLKAASWPAIRQTPSQAELVRAAASKAQVGDRSAVRGYLEANCGPVKYTATP